MDVAGPRLYAPASSQDLNASKAVKRNERRDGCLLRNASTRRPKK